MGHPRAGAGQRGAAPGRSRAGPDDAQTVRHHRRGRGDAAGDRRACGDAENGEKAVDAAEATVRANQADVDRLRELQGFERVYAPFAGIITARNVDPGTLITSGSTQLTTQLFSLAQVDTLRIFVYVPQAYAFDVRVGQTAEVRLREQPNRAFQGKVTRTAGAIDPASGTLLTEVQVPNPDGALLSGSYVTVHFKIQRSTPPLLIPGTALLADARGTRVAVIGPDDTLHYKPVEIGRDYGDRIESSPGSSPRTSSPPRSRAGSRMERR